MTDRRRERSASGAYPWEHVEAAARQTVPVLGPVARLDPGWLLWCLPHVFHDRRERPDHRGDRIKTLRQRPRRRNVTRRRPRATRGSLAVRELAKVFIAESRRVARDVIVEFM